MVDTNKLQSLLADARNRLLGIELEIAELQGKRDAVSVEIDEYITAIRVLERISGDDQKTAPIEQSPVASGSKFHPAISRAEMAEQVLKGERRLMRAADIVAKLKDYGFDCEPTQALRGAMFTSITRRTDLFTKHGSGLWGRTGVRYDNTTLREVE
ncbi:MAG: hypothetical protein U0941_15805 [Planctomycetaceae bacterium]